MQDTEAQLRDAVQRQAQRSYEQTLARMYPHHDDPEDSFCRAYERAKEFRRRHLADALNHGDPTWINAVGHAADKFIEAMDAASGEVQGPVRAQFIPEVV